MGEDKKKDYRLHLINTIDNAIDNGISVYDLDVVNKKAIRHNYINKPKVIDVINEYKDKIEKYNEYRIRDKETDVEYYENITNTAIVQVLQELLEGGNENG